MIASATSTFRMPAGSLGISNTSGGQARGDGEKRDSSGLTEDEQKQVTELKSRDTEVRTHENAHKSAGGRYAGSPTYSYQTGPDGQRYAIGGEVSIDASPETKPEATITKMEIVKRAALAPAEPSPQDYKVASAADKTKTQAQRELSAQTQAQLFGGTDEAGAEVDPQAGTETGKEAGNEAKGGVSAEVTAAVQAYHNAAGLGGSAVKSTATQAGASFWVG
jgi:hypothetical protein